MIDGLKGSLGNECGRTACNRKPAVGYNRSTGLYYCIECSTLLNNENKEEALFLFGGPLVILPNRKEKV